MKVDSCLDKNTETVELAAFVEDVLQRTQNADDVEALKETVGKQAEVIGKLIGLLADNGLVGLEEVKTIVPYGVYLSEVSSDKHAMWAADVTYKDGDVVEFEDGLVYISDCTRARHTEPSIVNVNRRPNRWPSCWRRVGA